MEKIKEFIKNDLYRATLLFCIIEFSFAIIVELSDIVGSITLWGMVQIFAFSLAVSCGMRLFKIKNMHIALAFLLHYAITIFSAYVVFYIFGQIKNTLGMVVLLSGSYLMIFAIAMIVKRFTAKQGIKAEASKKNKKDTYKKQF